MLVKIEARILIFPGTDFYFPSTSVPPGTFLGSDVTMISGGHMDKQRDVVGQWSEALYSGEHCRQKLHNLDASCQMSAFRSLNFIS